MSGSSPMEQLKQELRSAEAIVIGAGAGLSTAAGLTYDGERFLRYFSDFYQKYGITDMYSGGFYPFASEEKFWGWWCRHIWYNRYDAPVGQVYRNLLELVRDKNYFVLTTNVDHQFQRAGFAKSRLFYTQGDYGLFQCSKPCHDETYDNETPVQQMIERQVGMTIPSELLPKCPRCGAPMSMNLRSDNTFVQDKGWYAACGRYEDFLQENVGKHILFLELGVGFNTPGIIKYPFWRMTLQNPKAVYACINLGQAIVPKQLEGQSIVINDDISKTLIQLM